MVDTVKLLVAMQNPLVLNGSLFTPTLDLLVRDKPFGKATLNPSKTYAKMGKYMPRLTMVKRTNKLGTKYELAIEFSAPKMLFNNNFDELTEDDFEPLVEALQAKLYELLGYRFFKSQLAGADIGAWHASKNVVFLDGTSSQTILNTLARVDVSRVYDFQKDRHRDGGHVLHVHCNSVDIAFYDKLADLRKAKISEKRAFEQNSVIQLNLLASLEAYRPLEVFRYEVRHVGKPSVVRAYPDVENHTFEVMFKQEICQNMLLKHWQTLTSSVNMLSLDVKKPYELLQNYLIQNPDVSLKSAMAAVTGLLVSGQVGAVSLRNLIESAYGRSNWYRLKPLLQNPGSNRFTHFLHITETLEKFTPVRMTDFLTNIENTVK